MLVVALRDAWRGTERPSAQPDLRAADEIFVIRKKVTWAAWYIIMSFSQ